MMESAEQVKALRAAIGLTQKEFSARFGIPHRTLISWETGARTPPDYAINLLRLAVYSVIEKPRRQAGCEQIVTMPYREFSDNWRRCKTVKGSYSPSQKTIDVCIPEYLYDLWQVIPTWNIEDYRQTLIDSGHPELATTQRVLEIFADSMRGKTMGDCTATSEDDVKWIKRALDIANGDWRN